MEMQLENKKYIVVENVFSDKVLKILEPYAALLPTDKSSYNVWPSESTNNNTAPECFTCDVIGKDRLTIIDELYNNSNLPCFKKSWIKQCDIAVQKIPQGGYIPKHTDYCIFSLTVFLSSFAGGEFKWWDENNTEHVIQPSVNKSIIACYNDFTRGALHEVMPVIDGLRFTLQLFVFDKRKNSTSKQGAIILENNEK